MNILIAGLPRSGSTVLFNISKELLGNSKLYYAHDRNYKSSKQKENNLLKTHQLFKYNEWADIVLTTRSDLRDIIASFKLFHPSYRNNPEKWAKEFLSWHDQWKDSSKYEFVYKRFIENPEEIIAEIASVLGIEEFNSKEIFSKIESLKNINIKGALKFDTETLIHGGHITKNKGKVGGYLDILTENEIASIEKVAKDWLIKYNYM